MPIVTDCYDADDKCIEWAKDGECGKNYQYMSKYCKYSCNLCPLPQTNDNGKSYWLKLQPCNPCLFQTSSRSTK